FERLIFFVIIFLKLLPNIATNFTNIIYPKECFYCKHSNREKDIHDRMDQHPECLSYKFFVNKSQFRRICTSSEHFCMTSVTSLNGFFTEMRRDCTERCRPGCMESGYGIFSRTCTRCCQTTFCNNFDGRKFLLNDLDVQQLGGIYSNKTINIKNKVNNNILFNKVE
ncbi:Toxin_TOLIP domain-containing protein, partial [Meloidogyne graminicola]